MNATHTSPSQAAAILAHLRTGASLTPLEALARFSCLRLGARVHELNKQNAGIQKEMILTSPADAPRPVRVARYFIPTTATP